MSQAQPSRRERLLLASIAVAPFVFYVGMRLLGLMKFVKLAGFATVALAGATAVFLRPRWGLYFIVFYVYAGINFYIPVNIAGLLTLIVIAAVALELVMGGENRLQDPLFWYSSFIFFLIALGSMVWALDMGLAFHELGGYIKMLGLTYLIVQLIRTPEHLRAFMYVLFAGAIATVFLGVANILLGLQSVEDNYIRQSEYMLRFVGTHANPNRAAAFMCTSLPMGIFLLTQCRRWLKPFVAAGILILVTGIFATFSRSVVFPLTVIALAVLFREFRGWRVAVILAVVAGLGVVFTPHEYWERVFGLREAFETTTLDWSVYTRLLALTTAWELFLQHPFTGIGIGNFLVAAAYKLFVRIVVHNTYLEVLVSTGIFGLVSFLFILLSSFRHSFAGARARWNAQPAWVRSACFYCCLSAISVWMSAFFSSIPFRHLTWVPVGIGLAIGNLLRQDRSSAA